MMRVIRRADHDQSKKETFTAMVAAWQVPLRRMCCVWLKDMALAEDAAQETFLRAWKALDTFRGECSEKTWLMRIAVNVCRDMQRTWWHRHVDRGVALDNLPEPSCTIPEEDDALIQAVCALPAQQREVVLLYFYQDMQQNEIADVLHVSPSTVSRRLDAARRTLYQTLERRDDT